MRIIFVRHGHPDYSTDSLTETGHMQAAAAAKRLADEGISSILLPLWDGHSRLLSTPQMY